MAGIRMKTKDIVICGLFAAILFVVQVALAFLPNIELVSLLVLIYTLVLGRKTLVIICTFAILEGIFYGFGIWWVMYLYVWTILYAVVRMMRKNKNIILWAAVNGIFGLLFGALCALPYAAAGGIGAGIAWWVSGIPFDILHGIGNFVVVILLFKPVHYVVKRLVATETERNS